eukprot:TRINITY_DN346_c0_g2_i1.p1 TRINITY_DN346_c0_g2~~TRINITY_DN346_c0_g2_i1.p1  ORF type:complete len:772 (+),score=168.86 TRINITY_DN346_c0_g2_i1:43-2358(+)
MGCAGSHSASAASPGGGAQSSGSKGGAKQLLDEYKLGKVLGEGAFGVVYLCTKKGTSQEFAVKMIDKVETPLEDIKREAAMLEKMKHDNIVRLHDVYYEKVFVCMVMDIYRGGDMIEGMQAHWNSKGMIPTDKLKNILKQMVAGIAFVHSQGVVHRDVKGDNYLMDRKNIVDPACKIFLSDFGTVIAISEDQRLSDKCGTKVYWSPEFFALNYSFKVDIWAIGVVLYGLICGKFPFKGESDVNNKKVRLPGSCPQDLADLVSKMLERDEKKRFSGPEVLRHPWVGAAASEVAATTPAEALDFKPDIMEKGPNKNVGERRRELVERLEKAAAKGASTPATSQLVAPPFADKVNKPSFDVLNKAKGVTTTMEWWTESKVEESGILNLEGAKIAGPEVSGGSFEAIQTLLTDHKIDTTKFGQGNARSLEDFVNEVQTGSVRLMLDAAKHKSLVRVLDLVLLRLCFGDGSSRKFLIRQKESANGQVRDGRLQLPGTKRAAHENSLETAQRVLKERLQLTGVELNFNIQNMETFEEEEESASYPGVRTVYRKSIVEAIVASTADTSNIGIAGGKGIQTVDSKQISREYQWMTESECSAKQVKLRAPQQGQEVSALVNAPVGFDEEKLVELLQQSGVDTNKFGEGGAKSLEEFASELTSGEASLEKQKDGIMRIVDVVAVKLTRKGGSILVEAVETKDGAGKALKRLPAVKRRSDENQFLAAQRVLTKALAMDDNEVTLNPNDVMVGTEQKDSPSYPGIKTIYRKRIISASMVQATE